MYVASAGVFVLLQHYIAAVHLLYIVATFCLSSLSKHIHRYSILLLNTEFIYFSVAHSLCMLSFAYKFVCLCSYAMFVLGIALLYCLHLQYSLHSNQPNSYTILLYIINPKYTHTYLTVYLKYFFLNLLSLYFWLNYYIVIATLSSAMPLQSATPCHYKIQLKSAIP